MGQKRLTDTTTDDDCSYLEVRELRTQRGMTLAEILISLVILSVGLVMLASVCPSAMNQSDKTTANATCQAIAMNYFAMIKSLPFNFSESDLQNLITQNLPDISLANDELPRVRTITQNDPHPLYANPSIDCAHFYDRTVSNGQYCVFISVLNSAQTGVQGKIYTVHVGREGDELKMFCFLRGNTDEY